MSGPEYAQKLVETERELWALQQAIERIATEWERRRGTYALCSAELRAILARSRASSGAT